MTIIGILLAGGQSRRFGSPKAFAELDGEFFYQKTYRALNAVCDRVVIVAHPEFQSRFPLGLDVITDLPEVAGQGPLAGLLTAMSERPGDLYVVLPCDMPYVGPAETKKLFELMDVAMNITAIQTPDEKVPLFSIWKTGLQEELRKHLSEGGRRVMVFMEKAGVAWLDSKKINEDPNVFRNINRPEQ